jgi:hypothetical protein
MSKMEYRDYLFLKKLGVTGSVWDHELFFLYDCIFFFDIFSEKDLEDFLNIY